MNVSLNEVEATAKKAARGSGFAWGMAEEAGYATRWLCGQDIDGCAALAVVLQGFDGAAVSPLSMSARTLDANGRAMCPLHSGAALSDFANQVSVGTVRLDRVAMPVLLLPFAEDVAVALNGTVTLQGSAFSASIGKGCMSLTGNIWTRQDNVLVTKGGDPDVPLPKASRATPDPADWSVLNQFAHRTYAPATEASRLKGAGAGTNDND